MCNLTELIIHVIFKRLYDTWWHLNELDVLTEVRYRPALCLRIENSEVSLLHIWQSGRGYGAPWCWTQVCCDCVVPVLFNLQAMGKSTLSYNRKILSVCVYFDRGACSQISSFVGRYQCLCCPYFASLFPEKIVFVRGRWYLIVYCVCQFFLSVFFQQVFFSVSSTLNSMKKSSIVSQDSKLV